jgi:hypothetical protein
MSSSEPHPLSWNAGSTSALVNIGTHSLAIHTSGISRKPGEPAVIIIPGLACGRTGWAAVNRLLEPFAHVISYDRSGHGDSEESDEKPTSIVIAKELDALLRSAKVDGPFVLVGHSWGGILAREFLELRTDDVVGFVFVDANQEHTLEVLDWRHLSMSPVCTGIDSFDAQNMQGRSKLTPLEWKIYQEMEGTEKHQRQAAKEFEVYPEGFSVLEEKKQLHRSPPMKGNRPVCVIKGDIKVDFEMMFQRGLEMGNGSQEERDRYRRILDGWDDKDRELQKGVLGLSSVGKFIEVKGSGHFVNLTEPQSIVEGVRWVLERSEYS